MDNTVLDHLEILRNTLPDVRWNDTDEPVMEALEAIFFAIEDDDDTAANADDGNRRRELLLQAGLVKVVTNILSIDGHASFIYHRCFSVLATLVLLEDNDDADKRARAAIWESGGVHSALRVAREFSHNEMLLTTVMSYLYFMTKSQCCLPTTSTVSHQIAAGVVDCMSSMPEESNIFAYGCAILLNLCVHKEDAGQFLDMEFVPAVLAFGIAWYSWDKDVQMLGRELLLSTAGEIAGMKLIEKAEAKLISVANCSAAA